MKNLWPSAFQNYKPLTHRVFGAICLNRKGEVLLVKGRLSKKWSFPKGHCEFRERDIDCVKREVYEETGITLPEKTVGYHKFLGGGYFIFALEDPLPDLKINDSKEIIEVQWVSLEKLYSLSVTVDVSLFRKCLASHPLTNTNSEFAMDARLSV